MRPIACLTLLAPALLGAQSGDLLLVLNKNAAEAVLLDPATGAKVAAMPTGPFPHEVTVSPDGGTAVVANYGAQQPGSSLTVLDLARRAVVRTIDLGEYRRPHGIVWLPGGGRRVAVTSELSGNVLVVDVDAGRVTSAVPTGQQTSHMVVVSRDGARAYTANIGSGSVTLLDLAGARAVKTAKTGRGPEAIDLSPDGKELWAADRTLNYITILDAATLDSLGTLPTGAFPNRLHFTPDGRWVLVSNVNASTVTVYDARARQLVATIPVPLDSSRAAPEHLAGPTGKSALPLGILIAPDGRRAWVAASAMRQLAELDVAGRKIVRLIESGDTPDGMAYVKR
jgi:DNA-binding beta-propeller fold protein YncE